MSDSGGDIDDELLELAGATEKKRRKRQAPSGKSSSSSKRRRAEMSADTASEDEPESEEDVTANPYPLDGKYTDELDRQRLLEMSEIDREEILSQRLEELQRILDKRNLDQMLKAQSNRNGEGDSVSKAAKRQHAVKGATKEKTKKLDELKARRKAKDEKKRTKTNSPRRDRDRSSSPMDMETDSEEEEDGQISKFEEEEEKERRLYGKSSNPDDEPITLEDLNRCLITRDLLAKHYVSPWFEDYVKGAWVRYLIGTDPSSNQPIYRACEILNLEAKLVKPYKVNEQTVNHEFELKHGKSSRAFALDKTSNSPIGSKEFERLKATYTHDNVKLPSKRHLEKKVAQMAKLVSQTVTESDITAMLARKNMLQTNSSNSAAATRLEKSRLTQARTMAIRRQDYAELAEIDAKLAELAALSGASLEPRGDDQKDMWAKVNERNRKANLEAIRKAEIQEAERKRRERKLAASGKEGTATPTDPSARLKILPRTFNSASRPSTPNPNGTPLLKPQTTDGDRSVSPLPLSALAPGEAKGADSIVDMIDVDLGDF